MPPGFAGRKAALALLARKAALASLGLKGRLTCVRRTAALALLDHPSRAGGEALRREAPADQLKSSRATRRW
jgi:hypothetical protein